MQDVRRDFIPGVLSEEELGNKLYVHVLQREYAARVHNPRAYDAVSRDVLQRWVFPFVPDTNLLPAAGAHGPSTYTYSRHHIYRHARSLFPALNVSLPPPGRLHRLCFHPYLLSHLPSLFVALVK